MNNDLKAIINSNEKILWEGKPNKKCFIFESIFNPLLPFALIWGLLDFTIISKMFFVHSTIEEVGMGTNMLSFIIPFFLLHLMPVWIYIAGALLSWKRYKNTYYIITDKAIYVSGGIITKTINTKPFAEMSHIDLHRGFFDQQFNVGDVICTSNNMMPGNVSAAITISSISDYAQIYNMVKKLQQDIYSDIMYPNDQRPKENHGYNTEYKGF